MWHLLLSYFPLLSPARSLDAFDDLQCIISSHVVLALAVFYGGQMYLASPMQCVMLTAETDASKQTAVNAFCLMEGTYRGTHTYDYYFWTPWLLLAMSSLYIMPTLVYQECACNTKGLRLSDIVCLARGLRFTNELDRNDARHNTLLAYVKLLTSWQFDDDRAVRGSWLRRCRLTVSYFGMKLVLLAIALLQLYLLSTWFITGPQPSVFGMFEYDQMMKHGSNWRKTGLFARSATCIFEREVDGAAVITESFQCVMPLQSLIELTFLALYTWNLMLCFFTLLSGAMWLYQVSSWRSTAFKRLLALDAELSSENTARVHAAKNFATCFISWDSLLAIRLISTQGNPVIADQVLRTAWDNYECPVPPGPGPKPPTPMRPCSPDGPVDSLEQLQVLRAAKGEMEMSELWQRVQVLKEKDGDE